MGVSPDSYVDIQPGETKSTGKLYSDHIAYFRFIPAEDMIVSFYSKAWDVETQGYVFDADLNELSYNEWGGEGLNFKITYPLTAGNTYYFGAAHSKNYSVSFDVALVKLNEWEYSVGEDGTAEITKYNGNATDLIIPGVMDGHTVTSIGYNAFADHSDYLSKNPHQYSKLLLHT